MSENRSFSYGLSFILSGVFTLSSCASLQQPSLPTSLNSQSVNQKGLQRFLTGSPADQQPALRGPSLLLAGGGQDQVAAMQWQVDNVRGCTDCETPVDMVVLRASGADGYNGMLGELKGVDSIETFVITERSVSEQPEIAEAVARAEVIFFAGGDQCQYVRLFKGTALEQAVKSVFARGGGIGGTSAGLAIQGSLVYDACQGSVTSALALANPYHEDISFTQGFLDWPQMRMTLTDTHFAQRDRMGRLMAFLAQGSQVTQTANLRGIAVDEATALAVDRNGQATVFGKHQVYIVETGSLSKTLLPGQPLSDVRFHIRALRAGESIDLKQRPLSGTYAVDVRNGQLSASPYRP